MAASSCTCDYCRSCCAHKPGWFRPGEAERAAELLAMPFREFFKHCLTVDWWEAGDGIDHDVFVLSPVFVGAKAGGMASSPPLGRCVFFGPDERCRIYAARPYECAESLCTRIDGDEIRAEHIESAKAWDTKDAQKSIRKLLGHKPRSEPMPNPIDELLNLFGLSMDP